MKISIITINRNNESGLKRTIESVIAQSLPEFEYIVIDGASTDGSVDVIKQYADKIDYWVSEPDKGIYNAMNKGILKANGEYLLLLNSGDWLVDEFVLDDFCNAGFVEDVVSGNIYLVDSSDYVQHRSPLKEDLSFSCFYWGSLPHPASFVRRELFAKYGLYNEENKIVSDKEFFLKVLVENNCSYNHFERNIACFNLDGISSQEEWTELHKEETERVLRKYLQPFIYKSFLQINAENQELKKHEIKYREYMNLMNGKFSCIIKFILRLKELNKR